MYSIITSNEYKKQIKAAIEDVNSIIFEKVGMFDEMEILNVIQEATRVISDIFIIDITCHPEYSIVSAIRNLTMSRPNVRIIIVAPRYSPGNIIISDLVKMGIYDIVATPIIEKDSKYIEDSEVDNYKIEMEREKQLITTTLSEILHRPKNFYVDAARWDIFNNTTIPTTKKSVFSSIEKGLSGNNERLIIEKLLGTTTIAVGGGSHGVGTTHMAISISQFLSKRNCDVAFIELNNSKDIATLRQDTYSKGKLANSFVINGIDFYPYGSHELVDIIQAEYKYLVLDIGLLKETSYKYRATRDIKQDSLITIDSLVKTGEYSMNKAEYFNEFIRANCKVFVTGLMEWQIVNLINIFKDEDVTKWKFCVSNADSEMISYFKKIIKSNNIYAVHHAPDPLVNNKEQEQLIAKLLKDFLPNEIPKKSNFSSVLLNKFGKFTGKS